MNWANHCSIDTKSAIFLNPFLLSFFVIISCKPFYLKCVGQLIINQSSRLSTSSGNIFVACSWTKQKVLHLQICFRDASLGGHSHSKTCFDRWLCWNILNWITHPINYSFWPYQMNEIILTIGHFDICCCFPVDHCCDQWGDFEVVTTAAWHCPNGQNWIR